MTYAPADVEGAYFQLNPPPDTNERLGNRYLCTVSLTPQRSVRVEAGIARLVECLNSTLGFRTTNSCSGLRADHPERRFRFPEQQTEIQIAAQGWGLTRKRRKKRVRTAAQRAGLRFVEYARPSMVGVQLREMRDGTSAHDPCFQNELSQLKNDGDSQRANLVQHHGGLLTDQEIKERIRCFKQAFVSQG